MSTEKKGCRERHSEKQREKDTGEYKANYREEHRERDRVGMEPWKNDRDRRKCKSRRFCMGGRIY